MNRWAKSALTAFALLATGCLRHEVVTPKEAKRLNQPAWTILRPPQVGAPVVVPPAPPQSAPAQR